MRALLYHRLRSCANPARGIMMNKGDAIRLARLMADRLNGYRILILETREEAQFSKLARRARRRRAAMPDVHDQRSARPGARRGLDSRRHRAAARRSRADDRRRPAPADEGRAADRRSIRILSPRSARARKFARGPKPGRALREIGLEPQMTTEKPTSEGIDRNIVARRSLGQARRRAALSGQGSRRAVRRDRGPGRYGRSP